MQHLMIDLETLGTSPDSVILSIGAVKFDLASDKIDDEAFYSVVDIDDQFRLGRTVNGDTLRWWMQQSEEARAVFREQTCSLQEALENLASWIDGRSYCIWSNGADFDQPMLNHAYQSFGGKVPWSYADSRCYRTLKNLPGAAKAKLPARAGAHNALSDAVWQAQAAQSYYSTLFRK